MTDDSESVCLSGRVTAGRHSLTAQLGTRRRMMRAEEGEALEALSSNLGTCGRWGQAERNLQGRLVRDQKVPELVADVFKGAIKD